MRSRRSRRGARGDGALERRAPGPGGPSSSPVDRARGAAAQHRRDRHAAEAGIAVLVAIAPAPRRADVLAHALERGSAGPGARGFAGPHAAGVVAKGRRRGDLAFAFVLRAGAPGLAARLAAELARALIVVLAAGGGGREE